ncbi:MAG TPA: hypothetical protein VLB81_04800 [Gaiellales bacterium]|nr:hypothetical protein [Gaiellales bacterium]
MRGERLAWLVTLPIAVVGCESAHALANVAFGAPGGGRAELFQGGPGAGALPLVAALAVAAVLAGLASRATGAWSTSPAAARLPFALLAPALYIVQEHVETVLRTGAAPVGTVIEPTFLPGLLLRSRSRSPHMPSRGRSSGWQTVSVRSSHRSGGYRAGPPCRPSAAPARSSLLGAAALAGRTRAARHRGASQPRQPDPSRAGRARLRLANPTFRGESFDENHPTGAAVARPAGHCDRGRGRFAAFAVATGGGSPGPVYAGSAKHSMAGMDVGSMQGASYWQNVSGGPFQSDGTTRTYYISADKVV